MQMTRIITFYNSLIKGSGLKEDPLQLEIVKKIDNFLAQCKQPRYFWQKENKKGVYLHGSVGSGKTMLMDLFQLAAIKEDIKAQRFHYNEFMLDIHSSNFGSINNDS